LSLGCEAQARDKLSQTTGRTEPETVADMAAMKRAISFSFYTGLLLAAATPVLAQFDIATSTGLFDPTLRGAANTTWFGWGPGSFDGLTNDEIIDNPAPTLGTTTVGLSFNQSPTGNDILAGSDNIYSSTAGATDLLFSIPTIGTVGLGYTTIIVQGRTAFGGFDTAPSFGDIAGVGPSFTYDSNANGADQFWAKYEIPGNAASCDLVIGIAPSSFTSIAELEFDTFWSAGGYAADTVAVTPVPEPGSVALLGLGAACVGVVLRRRAA
jgi:hypothetical protein